MIGNRDCDDVSLSLFFCLYRQYFTGIDRIITLPVSTSKSSQRFGVNSSHVHCLKLSFFFLLSVAVAAFAIIDGGNKIEAAAAVDSTFRRDSVTSLLLVIEVEDDAGV